MNIQTISLIISDSLMVTKQVILATLGKLVTKKSGMLNLGVVEGMSFAVLYHGCLTSTNN
ncbi:hypothetical protein [Nostoc sp.]|uniref:hypothetical protein n=1 Tax=Nostoc sp. TaxID=1180 RepID=UPI002FFBA7E7